MIKIYKGITLKNNELSRIADMEKEYFNDPWSADSINDTLSKTYNGLVAFIEDEIIIGYILFSEVAGESELFRIAVDKTYRKKGIGSALMEAYKKSQRGISDRGFLEVRAGNTAAISLYEKFSYEKIGTRKKYYKNPEEDAIIYAIDFCKNNK